MTPQTAKEEMKQEDGDPMVRSRLRSMYRELLSQNMLNEVPKADVVITNPTHYSVALLYLPYQMDAPKVIAKGEDALAFRIREIAEANGVPVVSHPPLTRAIYQSTEVDDTIPAQYWNVVLIVLKKFFKFEEKVEAARRARESGQQNAGAQNANGQNARRMGA